MLFRVDKSLQMQLKVEAEDTDGRIRIMLGSLGQQKAV